MPIEMLSRIGRMLYGIGSLMTGAKVALHRFTRCTFSRHAPIYLCMHLSAFVSVF